MPFIVPIVDGDMRGEAAVLRLFTDGVCFVCASGGGSFAASSRGRGVIGLQGCVTPQD
jgi:hypothetical protein